MGRTGSLLPIPDASAARQVVLTGPYVPRIIDAPFFSADNRTVCFSAASPVTSFTPTWSRPNIGDHCRIRAHCPLGSLVCVRCMAVRPLKLTHLAALGLYAAPAPDGRHIALYTGQSCGGHGLGREQSDSSLTLPAVSRVGELDFARRSDGSIDDEENNLDQAALAAGISVLFRLILFLLDRHFAERPSDLLLLSTPAASRRPTSLPPQCGARERAACGRQTCRSRGPTST